MRRRRIRGAPGASLVAALAFAMLACLALASCVSPAPADDAAGFSPDEVARILAHGPWPPATRRDPTNRVSGHPAAIALGERLFADPRLSADGTLTCASCHDAARGFTDGRARARGRVLHDRNTQSLLDVRAQRWFGWDGGADSLWAAVVRPMLAPGEMASSPARVAGVLRGDPALRDAWAAAFGSAPETSQASDERLLADAAKAIAAWLETLDSPRTPFDDFRDALARGDATALARYPAAARRGLKLFVGRGQCDVCHFGPAFTNGEFHDIGRPFMVEPGRVDPGRYAGIRRVREDRFNLLGPYNDEPATTDPARAHATRTRTVVLQHRNWGEWRTPGLRGLSRTAPYTHDGSLATLRDVIRHYSELDEDRLHTDGEALLAPRRFGEREIDDLLAFLATLDAR